MKCLFVASVASLIVAVGCLIGWSVNDAHNRSMCKVSCEVLNSYVRHRVCRDLFDNNMCYVLWIRYAVYTKNGTRIDNLVRSWKIGGNDSRKVVDKWQRENVQNGTSLNCYYQSGFVEFRLAPVNSLFLISMVFFFLFGAGILILVIFHISRRNSSEGEYTTIIE